jgi:hypothetical protein
MEEVPLEAEHSDETPAVPGENGNREEVGAAVSIEETEAE